MSYRIESDFPLKSDWLPPHALVMEHPSQAAAVATAIEGVDDPAEQEGRVICVGTGEVVWRSPDEEHE